MNLLYVKCLNDGATLTTKEAMTNATLTLPILVSAPGKLILFGEHSVVYDKPAIAASLASLRTYLLVTEANDPNSIELNFPDINFHHKWTTTDFEKIPHDSSATVDQMEQILNPDTVSPLSKTLIKNITPLLSALHRDTIHYNAAFSFLYLYLSLCPHQRGLNFTIKSTSPIGAGLGSSASISVILVTSMLLCQGVPFNKELINSWSFIGEKCLHGDPSGIDNLVSTYGGAVYFKRSDPTPIILQQFPSIPMVLTYTKIPRSTSTLVGGVRELHDKETKLCDLLLDSMGCVTERAMDILNHYDSSGANDNCHDSLLELVRINHGLLVSLGVSHPGLEQVRIVSDELRIGETKLTGAGGGGCAMTILKKDIDQDILKAFTDTIRDKLQYEIFQTNLGGRGCCYVPRDTISDGDLIRILKVFQDPVTVQEIDAVLLPEKSHLQWSDSE